MKAFKLSLVVITVCLLLAIPGVQSSAFLGPYVESFVYLPLVLKAPPPAQLTLVNTVINDNGGTLEPGVFTPLINDTPVTWGVVNNLPVGSYTVRETEVSGYTASAWGGDCAANGTITLNSGQNATCTIYNNDQPAILTLTNSVTNDNGGTALPTNFTLSAAGPTPISGPGSLSQDVNAGTYTLSETGPVGYTQSSWTCTGGTQVGNQVTLLVGQSAVCSITNNDQPASLTLTKIVVNDNNGTATAANFTLSASGPTPISGPGGATGSVNAGTYTLSETGPGGYTASTWQCSGGLLAGNLLTLSLAQTATCTITNNDNPPIPTINNGNFDLGHVYWIEGSLFGYYVIDNQKPVPPRSGDWLAWMGGPLDEDSYVEQTLSVPAHAPYLSYWYKIFSQDSCGADIGGVLVNDTAVDAFYLCTGTNTSIWTKRVVNLSAYSGQSVTLTIAGFTNATWESNLFIEDVAWQANASPVTGSEMTPTPDDTLLNKLELQFKAHPAQKANSEMVYRPER